MRREKYTARVSPRLPLSGEQRALIRARTMPFIVSGTHLSIEHLMGEAYVQGLRDALQAQSLTDRDGEG